jgi:hypothetical protein
LAREAFADGVPGRVQLADSLDAARTLVPPGLFCMIRSPADDPFIVETWI